MTLVQKEVKNAYIWQWIDVTSLTLDKSSISLTSVWQTEQITATIVPAWTPITWSSSNTNIATVVQNSARLPSEYQEVEYIESTAWPYLKIWNYFNTSYIMEAKYQMPADGAITLWCNRWSRTPYRRYWLISNSSVTNVIAWWSSWTDLWTPWTAVHTIKIQGSTAYYDWVAYSISYSANLWINYWLWVFIYNNPSVPTSSGDCGKIFYVKISDSDSTPLYDLVPCYRKADWEIWMYDLVTNTFFTNQGTWTFTKWNDTLPPATVTCVTPWACTITASAFWVTADCEVTWPTSEYVLLSLGWDTNKYSELTLSWDSSIINNTTNWMWKVTATDHFWLHYKEFSQRIVWFEISMAPTYSGSSYEHVEFCIFTNGNEINSSNIRRPLNWFWFSQESKTYSWSATWKVGASQFVGWSAINFLNQNKSDSTTTWTWTGELINWVWNISVVLANGQSWSTTVTPDVANQNLYAIWFESGRWYTWTSGYFYSAKVKLA